MPAQLKHAAELMPPWLRISPGLRRGWRRSTPAPTSAALPTVAPTEVVPVAGDVTKGVTLYATHCAMCHGDQGQGTALAEEPLNSAECLDSRSDDDLCQVIADGIPDTTMPPYGNKLSTVDIADIIAFFRSWQQ
jgi:mono/diheme cytochrome c family protein